MAPHPLIRTELVRQRQLDLRHSSGQRRSSQLTPMGSDELTPIVRAAVSGDPQAWESLVDRFSPTMRGVVRGYRLNAADADDVVQAAWASAFVNIDRLREPEAIGGWLLIIARREALHTLERRRREVLVDEPHYVDESDHSAPESALVEAEQRHAVHAAVERLPDHQRRLVRMLIRHSGTSYADLSRQLDIPVGSIGPTRERAIARLRRDRGLTAVV